MSQSLDVARACWSWDSTVITALGMLVHLEDGPRAQIGVSFPF